MEMFGQSQVEAELWRLNERLEETTTSIAQRARTSAVADSKYKQEHAKQYLLAEGKTVGDREARAALETAEIYEAKKIAEALLMAAQEAARSYRSQLSALQTIASNIRALT